MLPLGQIPTWSMHAVTVPWEPTSRAEVHLVASQGFKPPPQPLTRMIGRDDLADEIARLLLADTRLITLTGPGGVGKTRLALHVAASHAGAFPDGVAFGELAPLTDPDLVLPTIAQALGVQRAGPNPLLERVARVLGRRRMLVVLDNFEQVVAAATAVARLASASPHARFLVTSRTPLRVHGEQVVAVPPLALPPPAAIALADLRADPSVRLFSERAHAAATSFALTDANAGTVADICRHLDGVPLAIELAASRIPLLPPEALLARLGHSLDVLSRGARDQPARLRDMRATIAWSYDLLPPGQRTIFRWLSIFAAGCPLETAEAMVGDALAHEDAASPGALDVIAALIDASLVGREVDADGMPRLTMLETIRQFGLERLATATDRDDARAWFTRWCLSLAERAEAAFTGHGPGAWPDRLLRARDNLRAGLAILDERGDIHAALRLASALAPLWIALGNEREGHRWLTILLARTDDGADAARVRAVVLAARLANSLGDLEEAAALARTGLELAEAAGDAPGAAGAACVLGNIARGLGDGVEARARYGEALSRYRALGDRYNTGYTLIQLGKLGDLGTVGQPGNADDLARATEVCEEALAIYRDLDNSWGIARALHQLGYLAYKRHEHVRAARLSSESLELFWRGGNLTEAASPIEDLADVAGATGHAAAAARLYGAAEEVRERLGVPMWPSYRDEYEREVAIARQALDEDRFQTELQAGRTLPIADVVAEARALAADLEETERASAAASEVDVPVISHGLTSRELDVLRLLTAGQSNRAIAEALFISVTTVKGHVGSIMDKLELHSRTAVAAWAHQHDLA